MIQPQPPPRVRLRAPRRLLGSSGRLQLLLITGVALVSLGGAYLLYYVARDGGLWGTTNHGTFVHPPLAVADLALTDEAGEPLTEGGTWWLWVVPGGPCDAACGQALHQLRQLHVLLNKDATRVRRALVRAAGENADGDAAAAADYPRLIRLTGNVERLAPGIYVVDPIGNLVFHYVMSDAGEPVLDDLKRLLKVSQIG